MMHLFALRQSYEALGFVHGQMAECDAEIKRVLDSLGRKVDAEAVAPPPPTRGSKRSDKNQHLFDLRPALYEIYGVDLTQVDGFQTGTVLNILAELGPELCKFPTEKHFTSYLGLCPNREISGGRLLKNSTKKVQSRSAEGDNRHRAEAGRHIL